MLYEIPMTPEFIAEIEKTLRLHSDYSGNYSSDRYLVEMDRLALYEPGRGRVLTPPA